MISITLDETNLVFYIYHPNITCRKLQILITDLQIDCTYYKCEYNLAGEFNIWIAPFNERIKNIVLQSKHFMGLRVKILYDGTIIHTQNFALPNRQEKYQIQNFYTNQFDEVGASYLDFFFGKMCEGIDFSGTVIDAGANIGAFTLYAKMQGAKRIYSIEPSAEPFFYLEKNFTNDTSVITIPKAFNNTSENIKFLTYINASVGSGEMNAHRDEALQIYNTLYPDAYWISDVESITIKDLLKIEPHINLLKLDIEGSEYKVIESMDADDYKQIRQIFVEFHPNDSSQKIFDILKNNGYTTSYLEGTENATAGWIYAKR